MKEHRQYLEVVNQTKTYVLFFGVTVPPVLIGAYLWFDWERFEFWKLNGVLMVVGYFILQSILVYWGVIRQKRVFAVLAIGFQLFHAGVLAWLAFGLLFDGDEEWAQRLGGFVVMSILLLPQLMFTSYIFAWTMRLLRGMIPVDLAYSKSLTERDDEHVEFVNNLDLLEEKQAKYLASYSGMYCFMISLIAITTFGSAIDADVAYEESGLMWQMASFFTFQLGIQYLGYYRRWKWMAVLSCLSHLAYGLLIVSLLGYGTFTFVTNGFKVEGEPGLGVAMISIGVVMTYVASAGIWLMILFTYRLFTRAGNGNGGGGVESDDEIDDRVDLLSQA